MRSAARRPLATLLLAGLAALWPLDGRALQPDEWKNRQSVTVDQAGVVKLPLPAATLDTAQPGLEDVRLLDPAGNETALLIEQPQPRAPERQRAPKAFRVTLRDATTEAVIETGTVESIRGVALQLPAVGFMKAVRIETSDDGQQWHLAREGAPVFRQFGAEQLTVAIEPRPAAYVRVTIDDGRGRAVPLTGAVLLLDPKLTPPPVEPLRGARIAQRDEFAGETVLTVDLGARNIPLADLEFAISDALFTRTVRITRREIGENGVVERPLASGTVYRLNTEGATTAENRRIPLAFTATSRELMVHVVNGDSPPLAVTGLTVERRPVWLVFHAPAPGTYALLTGNPDARAPRYDLAAFAADLATTPPRALRLGPLEENPAYHRHNALADTAIAGGPLDVSAWQFSKPVEVRNGGVHQLELNPEVIAVSRGLADLRLARDGQQVPYILERASLSRTLHLPVTTEPPGATRRTLSRWTLRLPFPGVPVTHVTLTSPMNLFQRHVRLFERVRDDRGDFERPLASADWNKTPGDEKPLVLALSDAPRGDTLGLETDNGDNPALTLGAADAAYPVYRLLFQSDAGPLRLYFGNREAAPPRYDVSLIATQLLAAEKTPATLGPTEPLRSGGWFAAAAGALRGGVVFWGALGVVVIALLAIVAKLLPKHPAA